jgi:8-oxo-dGTP diphosphatase
MFSYEYPRPGLTSDIALFRFKQGIFELLLIKRADYPYIGSWALPGGFVDEGETAELAAARELHEETGVQGAELQQVFTTSTPKRDPRGWTVSVIFYGFVPEKVNTVAGDDASEAAWFSINDLPDLAFDHAIAIEKTIRIICDKIRFQVFGHELFVNDFQLEELNLLYKQLHFNEGETTKLIKRLETYSLLEKKDDKYFFNQKKVKTLLLNGFL